MGAVPLGLRFSRGGYAYPTLKRRANNRCASGAGFWLRLEWSDSIQAPLRGHQP
jgi:hypothetical protein